MRRFLAIARTAAIETMSQPLSAILFPVALLAVHLLPAFQYHRFGAPGRLARETGLSALFVFGLLFAVPAVARAVGRELENGTAAAALALGVSRSLYFTARLAGTALVFLLFLGATFSAAALSSYSCVKAAEIFVAGEGVVRVWGPAFAAGVCASLAPFALAAAMNRFLGRRFCLWTCILSVALQLPGLALVRDASLAAKAAPAFLLLGVACLVYVAMAGALATRLKANGVAAFVVAAVLAGFLAPVKFLAPDMRAFWLAEGDSASVAPLAAGIALFALWTLAGCVSLERKELG